MDSSPDPQGGDSHFTFNTWTSRSSDPHGTPIHGLLAHLTGSLGPPEPAPHLDVGDSHDEEGDGVLDYHEDAVVHLQSEVIQMDRLTNWGGPANDFSG